MNKSSQHNNIYESPHYTMYRCNDAGGLCIFKETKQDCSKNTGPLLKYEFDLLHKLKIEGLPSTIETASDNKSESFIYDNIPGEPLGRISSSLLEEMSSVIDFAHKCVEILQSLHSENIIHCNLNPGTLIYDEGNGLCLTCLELARENGKHGLFANNELLDFYRHEYLAPELTGLIDIPVDHRADFYSLGIILYEMATGHVPFTSKDSLEMLHWHVARQPVEPININGDISPRLNAIITKLLKKDPEDRYVDAGQLLDALKLCAGNDKLRPAEAVAQIELPPYPKIVVGREREKKELFDMLDNVCGGLGAMTLIDGYPGVGKTELVFQLRIEVQQRGGFFIKGKYEQYSKDMPFHAIRQSLRMMARAMLMGERDELERWKELILEGTRPNTGLLVPLVPELAHVLGDIKSVPETDPAFEENRLMGVLWNFLSLLAQKDHPVVLFVDDLHWVDPSSLTFFRHIAIEDSIPYLYILGAYRDNEVDDDHPLVEAIEKIEQGQGVFHQLHLYAIDEHAVSELLMRWLNMPSEVEGFSKLVSLAWKKTAGNPFAMREFVNMLRSRKLISMENSEQLKVDEVAIEGRPASEYIIELIAEMLDDLPNEERLLVARASCIGSEFDIELLSELMGNPDIDLKEKIDELCSRDFLYKKDEKTFAFIHDRVQQAAYEQLNEKAWLQIHKKAGDLLVNRIEEDDNTTLFACAEQYFRAIPGIDDNWEEIKDLLHRAGLAAKDASAYSNAVRYFKMVEHFQKMEDADDNKNYLVYYEIAHCLYLDNRYDESLEYIIKTQYYAVSIIDKMMVINMQIRILQMKSNFQECLKIGLNALKLYDIHVNDAILEDVIEEEKKIIDKWRKENDFREIINLPQCNDNSIILLNDLMTMLGHITYQLDKRYLLFCTMKSLNIMLENGITPLSPMVLNDYAAMFSVFFNEYEYAFKIGTISFELTQNTTNYSVLSEVIMRYYNFVTYWFKHLKQSKEKNEKAIFYGINGGDYISAAFSINHAMINDIHTGVNIGILLKDFNRYEPQVDKLNSFVVKENFESLSYIYEKFTHHEKNSKHDDESFEMSFVNKMVMNNTWVPAGHYFPNKALYHYVMQEMEEAISSIGQANEYAHYVIGTFQNVDKVFFESLIAVKRLYSDDNDDREELETIIKENQINMKLWTSNCPDNFEFRYLLVEAELGRLNNDMARAMTHYDSAIESAHKYEYQHIEAIACELGGEFWMSQNKPDFAELYLRRSYQCYQSWGAERKLEQLKVNYPEIFPEDDKLSSLSYTEVMAVLKAFTALSGQQNITDIISSLAGIAMEHSGAEKFVLLMEGKSKLFVEAIGRTETGVHSVMAHIPFTNLTADNPTLLSAEVVRYVHRTGEAVIARDLAGDSMFSETPYAEEFKPRSVMCILNSISSGSVIWYLENNLMPGAFNESKAAILQLLANQAALCVTNALMSGTKSSDGFGLPVRVNRKQVILPYEEIVYVEAHGRKTVVHTVHESHEVNQSIKELEASLLSDDFVRIHRQHVVNLRYVKSIKRFDSGNYMLYLNDEDDTVLPVGRSQVDRVRELLKF